MLPISHERGARRYSVPASTPSSAHIASASLGVKSSSTEAPAGRRRRQHDAGDVGLGVADRLDGVGQRQRERGRDGDVDRAAEHARQRRRGRAGADVGELAQRVELEVGVRGHASGPFGRRSGGDRRRRRRRRSRRSGRSAPSERTAPPETAAPSATSGGSGRVTSSRWPTSWLDGEREALLGRRGRRRRASASGRSGAAERVGGVDERQHAVARARACGAPATERTAWSARRTVRSTRSSGIANGRPSASTSSAAMIASVSGRRICAVRALAELGGHARPRRRARGSRCAPRPCRRRGRRCRS